MTKRNQEISSGNYSNNFQGDNVSVNYNIIQFDEQKAREISEYSTRQVMKECFANADELAKKRMNEFEDKFIHRLASIENALNAFNDPSFKLAYRKAQIQAATTGSENDYDLLAELLIHRYNKKGDKISYVGINGAIEIIEQISDECLTAISVLNAIHGVSPASPNISEGLNVMNDLFQKIITCDLPKGNDWLDQLDILKALRVNSFGHLKKLKDFYLQNLDGYFCVGIDKSTDAYKEAIELLKSFNLEKMLVDHELIENHVRLQLRTIESIDSLQKVQSTGLLIPFSKEEKETMHKIVSLYDKDNKKATQVLNEFYKKFDNYPTLKAVHDWWDNIPNSFSITAIGRVLGHANAQRCCPEFPPLD